MNALVNTLRFILRHPLNRGRPVRALQRFLRWQVGSRLLPGAVAVPFVDETRLLVAPGMTGATGNIYCGLHEFEDMAFVLHVLRPGDFFLDVGANIGSYTILAAGASGAQVMAIEGHPVTCSRLTDNVRLNELEAQVSVRNVAVGSAPGVIKFTSDFDTVNHVMAATDDSRTRTTEVAMTTLDALVAERVPFLMKIDVEGYETEVLKGASSLLRSNLLQGVVMELNGSGARYGFDETTLHSEMLGHGFTPCTYEPLARSLTPIPNRSMNAASGNTLYLRDVAALQERLRKAPRHRVHENEI